VPPPLGTPDPLFLTPIRADERFPISSATFRYLAQDLAPTGAARNASAADRAPAWMRRPDGEGAASAGKGERGERGERGGDGTKGGDRA
jgi:hypothetical protein